MLRTLLAALLTAVPLAAVAEIPPQRPRLDVAFVLDTTGSMGDEIDVVKEKLLSIARSLKAGQPAPDVRYAIVAYRDKGDEYVTRTYDFDRNIERVQQRVAALQAGGGGDEPEDIAAALHATEKLSWDSAPGVSRVAFLVGDAGPHAYPGEPTWQHAVSNLRERKIALDTIGCSGLGGDGRSVYLAIAEKTGGHFQTLTYSRVEHLADGRKRTVLTAGDSTYVAERELSDADWKRGAEELAKEGKVRRAKADELRRDAMAAAPMAAPRNNLDSEIGERLKASAEAAGAAFH